MLSDNQHGFIKPSKVNVILVAPSSASVDICAHYSLISDDADISTISVVHLYLQGKQRNQLQLRRKWLVLLLKVSRGYLDTLT